MAIETLPQATRRADPQHGQQSTDHGRRRRPGRRRIILLIIGTTLFASLIYAATWLPLDGSSRQVIPENTHIATRGEMIVTVTEQGTLESAENTEIKCKVRGDNNTVIWVIEGGTIVDPGDELVRLDTLNIEEQIAQTTKNAHLSRSAAERSKADVAAAELAILEYEEGQFIQDLSTLQKDLAIAESNLLTAQNLLAHASMMAESGYVSELDIEEGEFAVTRAKLNVELVKTNIEVLEKFTKAQQLETLKGNVNAAKAQYEADKERAHADALRRDRAKEELQYCVMKAERKGIVIYPKGPQWKKTPQIEEGATVHKDQVLLLMPNLAKMQVKVGIHESIIDRVHPGLAAKITLPDKSLDGTMKSVASVTRPAGWWTGNVVKYDAIVELPETEGLKPGMTAEVEVVLARYDDVLTIPVTAVVETNRGYFCWIVANGQANQRVIELGDSNDMFVAVEAGLKDGDEVVLDPLAYVEEAQTLAARTLDGTKSRPPASTDPGNESHSPVMEPENVD